MAPQAAPGPGVLRWALGADPTSLDPARIVREDDALLVDALFDSLTRLGADATAEPALAVSWESNEDATQFTFRLDPEAVWHDGTQVVAADVVRGLVRIADGTRTPTSLHADLLRDVVGFAGAQVGQPLPGVTALDDATVVVELVRPVPELPVVLAHPALAPVPPAAVDDPSAFGEAPIGNGPFQLAEPWAHNQFLRFVPSSTHPAPDNLAELVFRIYASDGDRATRHADVLAGQIQVSQVPTGRRAELLADPDLLLLDGQTDTVSLLLFDTRQPPFDDVRFRRGVSMLLDREAAADRTDGARTPARSLVPAVLPGAGRAVCAWCRHDPDRGFDLLSRVLQERAIAAEPPPPTVVLQTSTDELHGRLAEQLSAALRSAGLQVTVERVEAPSYLATANEERPAALRLGWSADEATLRPWTEQLLGIGSTGARLTGWQPDALLELLARAEASPDPDLRRRTWQQVERLVLDAAVVSPVLHYRDDLVVAAGVQGLRRDPYGNVDLTEVSYRTDGGGP